jgi:2-polyprenyl-6-methoxyphenol hydroxylase-like FAD-dependent oxidoreductase
VSSTFGIRRLADLDSLVHWKLRWRDLNRQWTSDGGRIVQVGDSAHSFLPASGNGATQALEDAVSLATCLQLAGRSNAAVATKIHNRLRYERISCAQMMSFVNTQQHHFTDWTMIAVNPKMIRTRFPSWVSLGDSGACYINR